MTLKELYSQVRGKKGKGQVGKYQLLLRHERQLAKYVTTMGEGTIKVMIRVFESGYVLYEEDEKFSVFHLDDICGKDKEYDAVDRIFTSRNERMIPSEVYMSADWTLRIILEGNERIMHNREKVENDHVEFSYSGISEDMFQLGFTPNFFRKIEEEINKQKMIEVFKAVENAMKPVQWNVYIMIERDGKRQKDIADMLGKSQQAVSKDYKIAKETIDSLLDKLKKMFYED
ncbi:MAG: hypothetical protein K6G11_08765 [Lachnospiraceae bacterium]|nr:hypothetical protein [Lachnospiraceae bacterium]